MKNPQPDNTSKNLLEWIVFAISSLIVLATLGCLVNSARVEIGPAKLAVTTGSPDKEDGRTRIPVVVSNNGKRLAANVEIQISIGNGEAKQQAGFTLDFVPRDASRQGTVSFKGTDLKGPPECEVLGYEEP